MPNVRWLAVSVSGEAYGDSCSMLLCFSVLGALCGFPFDMDEVDTVVSGRKADLIRSGRRWIIGNGRERSARIGYQKRTVNVAPRPEQGGEREREHGFCEPNVYSPPRYLER